VETKIVKVGGFSREKTAGDRIKNIFYSLYKGSIVSVKDKYKN